MTLQLLRVASLLVALTAILGTPVQARDLAEDAKCLLVSSLFAKSSDEKIKQAGSEARLFYLGRLDGSPAQTESVLRAQSKALTKQNVGLVMQACSRAFMEKANQVQAIGQRLQNVVAP